MANLTAPIRLEILKNALESIADGMAIAVVRTARSSNVRQSLDFSCGLLNSRAELIAQGACIPAHLGGMPPALEACLARYGDRIYPGDIFINNDPYEGGSHLPDIFLYKPIFVGDRVVAYTCAMSHHTDMGGRVAGSNACDSTEIYQEGLRIPPLKLYHRGEPNETIFRILEKAVRVPEMVLGDVISNVAALHSGERGYLKLVDQYGLENLEQSTEELLDYTERLTRQALSTLPDGSWSFTDYIDDDGFDPGPIAIVTNLTKKGEELGVDFTGTSPQCKGAIQPVFATTKAIVYAVIRCVTQSLGYDTPNTQGYFRPVKITAPEGSFVNPRPPAPVAARGLSLVRISQSVFGAFAQMIPDRIPASSGGAEVGVSLAGYTKTKTPWRPWVHVEFHVEQARGGATAHDGLDAHFSGILSVANAPAEVLEAEQPLKLTQYSFLEDSEGAGKFRGGLGLVREWETQTDDTVLQVRSDRAKHGPYGLNGGHSAKLTEVAINPGRPDERRMPSKFLANMKRGDHLRIAWSGAGGWGDPLERDPNLVLAEVVEEKIGPQRAREVYGVVLNLAQRQVDYGATARLRQSLRQEGATAPVGTLVGPQTQTGE